MIKGKGFNFPRGFCLAAVWMRTPCDVDNGQRPSCGVLVICPRVLGVSAETRNSDPSSVQFKAAGISALSAPIRYLKACVFKVHCIYLLRY